MENKKMFFHDPQQAVRFFMGRTVPPMTQADLCRASGVKDSNMVKFLKHGQPVGVLSIRKICEALKLSPEESNMVTALNQALRAKSRSEKVMQDIPDLAFDVPASATGANQEIDEKAILKALELVAFFIVQNKTPLSPTKHAQAVLRAYHEYIADPDPEKFRIRVLKIVAEAA